MKFCDICENMMFIRLGNVKTTDPGVGDGGDDDAQALQSGGSSTKKQKKKQSDPVVLEYECKNCGRVLLGEDLCILETNYMDDRNIYKQYMSRYISHDVTLPRVKNIPCPTCGDEKNKEDDDSAVTYVKYDANLKFLYFCERCETFWKSGKLDG